MKTCRVIIRMLPNGTIELCGAVAIQFNKDGIPICLQHRLAEKALKNEKR